MDKIYSRPRIRFFYTTDKENKKNKKKITIFLIIIITILTVVCLVKSLDPIFENLCKDKAMEIATKILNKESTNVWEKYDCEKIVSITKSDENNILKVDIKTINQIASDLALQVTNGLEELASEKIRIPIGAMSGNKFLSGMGPKINITIIPSGTVTTKIKTEFKSQGINQTVYRIYLEIICDEKVLTSYKSINTRIVNQLLLVETVIVGNVPETYYNLEGVDKESSIDIIE